MEECGCDQTLMVAFFRHISSHVSWVWMVTPDVVR